MTWLPRNSCPDIDSAQAELEVILAEINMLDRDFDPESDPLAFERDLRAARGRIEACVNTASDYLERVREINSDLRDIANDRDEFQERSEEWQAKAEELEGEIADLSREINELYDQLAEKD